MWASKNGGVLKIQNGGVYAGEKLCGFPGGTERGLFPGDPWYAAVGSVCHTVGGGYGGTVSINGAIGIN